MRYFIAKKARTFRRWLLTETKTEVRAWQDLYWLNRHLTEPVAQTNMSLQSATLLWVINDLRINRRQCIVELGAGYSTQLIAQCLKTCYGTEGAPRFFSVEENADWIAYLKSILRKDGLEEYVTFVHAPRTDYPNNSSWYAEETVSEALEGVSPDLLIVDGPSIMQAGQRENRRRSLTFFRARMADRYSVFIDDAQRPAERQLLQDWAAAENLPAETLNAYLGVIVKGDHYVSRP